MPRKPGAPHKPHHSGSYHVQAMALRRAAAADPMTRCWRCKQTLATCGPNRDGRHKNGKPARWTAGHVVDGQVGGPLLPECSPCMASSGATYGNQLRGARRATQKAAQATQRDTSWRW